MGLGYSHRNPTQVQVTWPAKITAIANSLILKRNRYAVVQREGLRQQIVRIAQRINLYRFLILLRSWDQSMMSSEPTLTADQIADVLRRYKYAPLNELVRGFLVALRKANAQCDAARFLALVEADR